MFRSRSSLSKSLAGIFLFSLFCLFGRSVAAQDSITTLEPGKLIEREIARREKHVYQIILTANQYASVVVEQRGIDVAVAVSGADKKPFAQRDARLKTDGQERIDFVALAAGVYFLEVRTKPNAAESAGRYSVLLTEKRAASEKEKLLEEARKFHTDALEFYDAGDYDEALRAETRALEIREQQQSLTDADTAASLSTLALIWSEKGDDEKAVTLFTRSLEIREKLFGTFHEDVARTLHNLARAHSNLSNFEEAVRLYAKAIEIREKVSGKESAELAASLNNLGQIYANLADYDKSEQTLMRALEIKEKVLPPTSTSIASTVSNLASVFSDKGDEDKALELFKRALEIREKALGAEHPDVARSLEYLGTSYRSKGDYKNAEAAYLRGLEILRKKFGAEHYRIARSLGSLAVLYSMSGDYLRAEPLFRQTVEMMEKTVGREHTDYATALYNLAWFYTDKGDYKQAEPLYKEALAIAEKIFGAPHPDVVTYLNGLARNHQAKGETAAAVAAWTRARSLSERNMQAILFTSSEKQKLLYLNSLAGETNQYLSAHLRFAPSDRQALDLALTTLFERKGRVSDALAFEFSALRSRFDKNDQVLLDDLRKVTAEIAQKVLNGPTENAAIEAHQKQIAALEEQKEKLETEISRRSAEFRAQSQTISISAIQAAIPETAALVEFGIYSPFDPQAASDKKAYAEPRYVVYILRKQGAIYAKDLGTTRSVDTAIEAFRQALRDPKRKDVQELSRAVEEKIMSPVRAALGDVKQLLVSPDGALNLIPFEALVDEKESYLVENYSFTYLTSGRDLLRMQIERESKSKPLIVANPIFGEAITGTDPVTAAKTSVAGRRNITAARELSGVYFMPLIGTRQEARSIRAIFPEAVLMEGGQATESVLKQSNAPQILHVATHGFFLEDAAGSSLPTALRGLKTGAKFENPLLRSGLALAGANTRKSLDNDGILTALEAANLNLWGTKLVVLSACDTGLGEIRNGEGVYGLRRAFVLAGAESLVMSLWSVSDLVTRELMTGYYKNLRQGAGRGAALRQVQLEMLKRADRRHPFYWASFIQSGNWTNLDGKR